MTWALIRKDVRIMRPAIIAAVVLCVLFYVIIPGLIYPHWARVMLVAGTALARGGAPSYLQSADLLREAGGTLTATSMFVWFFNLAVITAIAGMAFSVERRERWADFAAMLPVSAWRQIAAKAITSMAVIAAVLLVNVLVIVVGIQTVVGWHWQFSGPIQVSHDFDWITLHAAVVVGMVGTAWLLSSLLRSPVLATIIAVGLVAGTYFTFLEFCVLDRFVTPRLVIDHFYGTQRRLAEGIAGFGGACGIAGTIVQLRRKTP